MPKVSVVIAAFNCNDFIKETVESVLSQTLQDFEIIIVDDYSTDGTRDALRDLKDARIKLIFSAKNSGPSEARNEGMRRALGEYIAILDHDDKWMPTKLERQIELFDNDKDVGLVYCDCLLMDRSGRLIGGKKGRLFDFADPKRGHVFKDLILSNFIPTSAVIFRREIMDKAGLYDKQYFICQDFDYYLRISKLYKIDYIAEPLVLHRWFVGARTRHRETTLKEATLVTKKHLKENKFSFFETIRIRRAILAYQKELILFRMRNK